MWPWLVWSWLVRLWLVWLWLSCTNRSAVRRADDSFPTRAGDAAGWGPAPAARYGCGMSTRPSRELVTVDNPHPGRDYEVRSVCPELTCICPVTGQPDFATVTVTYVPDRLLVELKSLKLYLWSYRDEGAFHEDITNRILDDLVAAASPRRMTVHTLWNVRGGITTDVTASHP